MPVKTTSRARLPEMESLLSWLGNYPRSPSQVHGVYESDCEIIRLPDGSYYTSTVDSIAEEIALGLYRDPFTMGWVSAQTSLSDLAAVGSHALGVLWSCQWGKVYSQAIDEEFKSRVAEGFHAALKSSGVFLLGGDSGLAASTVLTSVGLGTCHTFKTRMGVKPGDYLCVTGKTGVGPALAFRFLRGEPLEAFPETYFRPQARLKEGVQLARFASAMMDTSDGLLTTLNSLRLLNHVGLDLEWNEQTLEPTAVEYCLKRDMPLWLLWVGEHGDFEIVAAIPPENLESALKACPGLKIVGRAVDDPNNTRVKVSGRTLSVSFEETQFLNSGQNLNTSSLASKLNELSLSLRVGGFV